MYLRENILAFLNQLKREISVTLFSQTPFKHLHSVPGVFLELFDHYNSKLLEPTMLKGREDKSLSRENKCFKANVVNTFFAGSTLAWGNEIKTVRSKMATFLAFLVKLFLNSYLKICPVSNLTTT